MNRCEVNTAVEDNESVEESDSSSLSLSSEA